MTGQGSLAFASVSIVSRGHPVPSSFNDVSWRFDKASIVVIVHSEKAAEYQQMKIPKQKESVFVKS